MDEYIPELIDRKMLQMGATRIIIDGVEFYPARDIDRAAIVDPVHAAGACYCKECKYFKISTKGLTDCLCPDGGIQDYPRETDFCSYGVEKEIHNA